MVQKMLLAKVILCGIKSLLSISPVCLQTKGVKLCPNKQLQKTWPGLWYQNDYWPSALVKVSVHRWWRPHLFKIKVFWGFFLRRAEPLIHTDSITRTHGTWVTGVSRKHISHVLKTLLLTSTVDQCHHSETQTCLVTAFVRSSRTQPHPNRSSVSNHIKNLKRTKNIHLIGTFSVSFCAFICLLGLRFAKICFWKSGFTPFCSGNLVFLSMIWPDCATRVWNVTLWRERLERRRAAVSFQPLTVHMLPVKREIISNHSLWICSMAWWKQLVCDKTRGYTVLKQAALWLDNTSSQTCWILLVLDYLLQKTTSLSSTNDHPQPV